MSGRGKGDGSTWSGNANDEGRGQDSSSQRDTRPPLLRNRVYKVPPPPPRPQSRGGASSSSISEERPYQTPPPDLSTGPKATPANPAD
eukprot:3237305-Amphidinium_carterae.1